MSNETLKEKRKQFFEKIETAHGLNSRIFISTQETSCIRVVIGEDENVRCLNSNISNHAWLIAKLDEEKRQHVGAGY